MTVTEFIIPALPPLSRDVFDSGSESGVEWGVGLARSLDSSGLGLSVFWHARTGFQFGLFQSLIVYNLIHIIYSLEIEVKGNCIFLMKLLVKQQQQFYLIPPVW